MAQTFNIRDFFRRSPREWLRRYFQSKGALANIDWSSVRPRDIEPLMDAWRVLDGDLRGQMVEDFSAISLLATPIGKIQIIDEAAFHGREGEVSAKLSELGGFYECAFWTFFEQPTCWDGALAFGEADAKHRGLWRKRINMPQLGRAPTAADGKALAIALTSLFREKEGRGEYCIVEQLRRGSPGEPEYYFAYPQDHRQMALEYNKGEMTKRPHRPAFEVIFIHDDRQRTLSIWHRGKKERIVDLQVAFAKAVLGRDIPRESPADDRVYDLNMFLDPDFVFRPRPELGIAGAETRKISIRVLGAEPLTIHIDLGPNTPAPVLYRRLKAVTAGISKSMLKVTKVGVQVTFDLEAGKPKRRTRTVELAWPNHCKLAGDSRDLVIQRMLVDHGVELARAPADEASDGSQID
jgi:hypothetical protein